MGRIRPSFVKIRAIKLVNEYPGEFTPDFENNKNLVEKYTEGANKRMRNWIAGYITRYVQRRTDWVKWQLLLIGTLHRLLLEVMIK